MKIITQQAQCMKEGRDEHAAAQCDEQGLHL